MKLLVFHGNDTDDPKQYWLLYEAVWIARQTTNADVKKFELATTFQGCALDWYMRFIHVMQGTAVNNLDEI